MPRADYYILPQADHDSRELFVCRLCEKALNQGLSVQIFVDHESDLRQLDNRLWSFRADAFVPHAILGSNLKAPVRLTADRSEVGDCDLLINLGALAHPKAAEFSRVAEVISQDPEILQEGRRSYVERRDQGWELTRHDMRR